MEKQIMDAYIDEFIDNYERIQKYHPPMKIDAVRKLMTEEQAQYGFKAQQAYEYPEYFEYNLRNSVQNYKRNKDNAIKVYKLFLEFLSTKGISSDVTFPPIPVSNSFERLMYIAKYFHEPGKKISELSDILWVDQRTIKDDIKKLMGIDNDPLQVCGKKFEIPEIDSENDSLKFESTAHPLFLTPNITQLIVTLKGLKEMSENPLYGNSAKITAAIIWEQLSDYAKRRIPEVLTELLSEDPAWYENLEKTDKNLFHLERAFSMGTNIIFYSIKDRKSFCIEVLDGDNKRIYTNCRTIILDNSGDFSIISDQGEKTLSLKKVIQTSYTLDGIH